MDLKRLYGQVKNCIDRVDFSKLWRDFSPLKFALYTDSECFFAGAYIEKTDAFLANTSILYNGEWIAIWYVQEEISPLILASKIVHEMFHGFQQIHQESRFFDELDALYHYKYEEDNLNLKMMENHLLHRLTVQFDEETFKKFLQIRKYRSQTFSYACHYESCIEQIEGSANFAELHCLKQLSAELFEKKLSAMRERIISPNNLLPVRAVCYDIGALLLYVMTENQIEFADSFSSVLFSESILDGIEGKAYAPEHRIGNLLEHYRTEASEIIRRAIDHNALISDTPCNLLAVNVYNAVFHENHIISRYFVMFGSEDDPQTAYGDFVIETHAYKKAAKIYRIS